MRGLTKILAVCFALLPAVVHAQASIAGVVASPVMPRSATPLPIRPRSGVGDLDSDPLVDPALRLVPRDAHTADLGSEAQGDFRLDP